MTTELSENTNSGPGYLKYPDHSIKMAPFAGGVSVQAGGKTVAESDHAILLTETGHSPVYYLPRNDVFFEELEEVELSTYCPFKGHARYWRLAGGSGNEPIVWAYDAPYDEVLTLSRYVAFYEDRVTLAVSEAA